MVDLVGWLTACLDEDERIARAATPGPWRHNPDKHHHVVGTPLFEEAVFAGPPGSDATCVAGTGQTDDQQSMTDASFIAAHDPARVLREINAKRSIIRAHAKWCQGDCEAKYPDGGFDAAHYWSLKALAAVYADRPGYRKEWAP